MHSRQIHSIHHALSNLKQGDRVFFDIDKTLLLTGINKYQDPVQLTEENLDLAIKNLQEKGISVLGLTARQPKHADLTVEQLKSCQISLDTILYAPSNPNKRRKGSVLQQYIQNHTDLKKVIVIDDDQLQLEDIWLYCSTMNLSLCLYHYQRSSCQRISDKRYFPSDLSQFNHAKSLGGGTESTFKISSKKTSLVLKFGAHPDAIKIEILCNAIYAALGVQVPKMEAYNTLPTKLALLKHREKNAIVQVSEYIESGNQDKPKIILKARNDFIIHALLGNIDVAKWDNYIVDKKNHIYLIDAGDNFIFRALGEKRKEDARWITEIDSLRNADINKQAHAWFHDLSEETLKQQVLSLIKKIPKLEKTIQTVMDKIALSDRLRMNFLQFFSERLDQLSLRFCPNNQLGTKPDKSARPQFTAAGVLTYTFLNNEPHVLLSQRLRHKWWANFGGKSDAEDNYLEETAGREVFEESSGRIKYTHHRLRSCAFHDLITQRNGNVFVYRMYLAEHSYVDPKDIQDHEHTAHQWVPLEKLLTTSDTIKHKQATIMLYPPLYQMLQQSAIKENLVRLQHKQPLKLTHTQGSPNSLSDKDQLRHVFNSPEYMSQQINQSLIKHSSLLREFKLAHLVTAPKSNYAFDLTPSELHMKMILGPRYSENNLTSNINHFIKYELKILSLKINNKQKEIITDSLIPFIENEKDNDFLCFYHGVDKKVAFAYQIYSFFHQILQLNDNWHAFRAFNTYTGQFKNIVEFIAHYSNNDEEEIYNDAKNFHECAIAANIFMLGNHESETSNSLYFAVHDETRRKANLPLLIKNLFGNFSLASYEIELFLELFEKYNTEKYGHLYQIGIPIKDVAKLTYPAGSLGRMNAYAGERNLLSILTKIRENFDVNNQELKKYMEKLQVRILVPPHQFFKIEALQPFSSPIKQQQFHAELKQLVEDITHSILKNTMDYYSAPIDSKTPMLRLFKEHYAKNQLLAERTDTIFALTQAILTNNNHLVLSILKKYPAYKTIDLSWPEDYLDYTQTNAVTISMLKMVLFYSELDKKTIMQECCDEDLPDLTEDVSELQLLNILDLLSAKQCVKLMDDYYNRKQAHLICFAVSDFKLFNNAWPHIVSQRFFIVNEPNPKYSLLDDIIAASNLEIFNLVWDDFSDQEKLSIAKMQSYEGIMLLHRAADKSHLAVWKIIWAFYAQHKPLLSFAMHQKIRQQFSIIELAIDNLHAEVLHDLVTYYPQEKRGNFILKTHRFGDTALHQAARKSSPETLFACLDYLPEADRWPALNIKNLRNKTPLDKMKDSFMTNILKYFSIPDRLSIILHKGKFDSNLLIRLANLWNVEDIIITLNSIPKEDLHLIVLEKNESGKSFLEKIIQFSIYKFCSILNIFPESLLTITFATLGSKIFSNAWNHLFNDASPLQNLLKKLNEEQLTEIFVSHSILDKITEIGSVIAKILIWLPASIRSLIFTKKNSNGHSILHKLIPHETVFTIFWDGLPDNEKSLFSTYEIEVSHDLWHTVLQKGNVNTRRKLFNYYQLNEHNFKKFLTSKSSQGSNIFHYLVNNRDEDLSLNVLKKYSENLLYSALNQPNNKGRSPLYLAAFECPALCNILLASIPTLIHLALNEKQKEKNTLFDVIIESKQELVCKIIFDNLPINEFLLKIKFHSLISKTNIFIYFWRRLSIDDQIMIIKEKDYNNYGLLQAVLLDGDTLLWKEIWKFYLKHESFIKEDMKIPSQNTSFLHIAAEKNNWKYSQDILKYLFKNNQLDILYLKNNQGETSLDIAFSNDNIFDKFFRFLCDRSRDNPKTNPIHLVIRQSSVNIINFLLQCADYLISDELDDIFNAKDSHGKTFFHSIVQSRSPKIVESICFFTSNKLTLMSEKSNYGNTALHFAAKRSNGRKLKILLKTLPLDQILMLLTEENHFGNTPIHLVAKNNAASLWPYLQKFLQHHFSEQYLQLLKLPNRFGKTPVHSAAENTNPKVLDRMLSCKQLSDEDRLELVNLQNMYGNTPLHRAAKNANPALLAIILKYLPEPIWEGKYQGNAFFRASRLSQDVEQEERQAIGFISF